MHPTQRSEASARTRAASACFRADPFSTVGTLLSTSFLDWYRDGGDVQARLPVLSTWLGHIDPKSTYYYLSAVPELLALAAARLEPAGRDEREAS
jgi:integrase